MAFLYHVCCSSYSSVTNSNHDTLVKRSNLCLFVLFLVLFCFCFLFCSFLSCPPVTFKHHDWKDLDLSLRPTVKGINTTLDNRVHEFQTSLLNHWINVLYTVSCLFNGCQFSGKSIPSHVAPIFTKPLSQLHTKEPSVFEQVEFAGQPLAEVHSFISRERIQ